jgi:hypothetical protein
LDCCRQGEVACIGTERPDVETDANHVRAAFVRFLLLGGDEQAPVHELGVQLYGAWLVGPLDIEGAAGGFLALTTCRIERIEAFRSKLTMLTLGGSLLAEGMAADGLDCRGGVFLGQDFQSNGEVRLLHASIGVLQCSGGCFENAGGHALSCDGAVINGDVSLDDGFRAGGEVRLHGSVIGGDVICCGGRFENAGGRALSLDRATVAGDILLSDGFHASGGVGLIGSRIEGDLVCHGGQFDNELGRAILCDGARVSGAFFFRRLKNLKGGISLSGMRVTTLCDDNSWRKSEGQLVLDAFIYDRLAGGAPTKASSRIEWLLLQRADHLGTEFRPQPWEHLITVLRAMGHPEDARTLAVARHEYMRKAGRYVGGSWAWDWIYGRLVGYGYRPMRLLISTAAVWLLCAAAYWAGTNPESFGVKTHILAPVPPEAPQSRQPPDYANFVPLIYSADVLLPVVDLGYKKEWRPVVADPAGRPLFWGQALRFLYWFEIAFGWVAGLLLVGVLGNLIKKD